MALNRYDSNRNLKCKSTIILMPFHHTKQNGEAVNERYNFVGCYQNYPTNMSLYSNTSKALSLCTAIHKTTATWLQCCLSTPTLALACTGSTPCRNPTWVTRTLLCEICVFELASLVIVYQKWCSRQNCTFVILSIYGIAAILHDTSSSPRILSFWLIKQNKKTHAHTVCMKTGNRVYNILKSSWRRVWMMLCVCLCWGTKREKRPLPPMPCQWNPVQPSHGLYLL